MVYSWFVIHRKKFEEDDFLDEKSLHKKINNKDLYMWIIVCYTKYSRRRRDIVKKAVRHCGDLTALK